MNLLSDAAQSETWPSIKPQLVEGKVRIPSILWRHGSSIVTNTDSLSVDPVLLPRFLPRLQGPHQG